ncbi:putative methyltransferase [Encephalitozoon intestinalis ATCC 50506]|uniref:Methyltransferase n=1 Tax=Encephalitozoon intestinalis (strain ATCC 50506) TaxID=876142 RepID=E0S8A7_ENCIT|nr:putative methyltransferase [Encephalitozoon intestinalis ATCC 50506]ADM12113.1 putative methyltransferase [Encephalitozoon intestinalis ATCC 50506]UTX45905.1 methyltransferase-like protein 5 [Encephalitozoon intestinalis]
MKVKKLKMELSKVEDFSKMSVGLEQYMTPPDIAASMISIIHSTYDDIEGKSILDLCCGTGMLSFACSYFSPSYILGVDLCPLALSVFKQNNLKFKANVDLLRCSIDDLTFINEKFDTAVINPPFGTKIKHADIKAVDKALELCDVVYSLHKTSTREYIVARYPSAEVLAKIKYELPRRHDFHKKDKKIVEVDFVRILKRKETDSASSVIY